MTKEYIKRSTDETTSKNSGENETRSLRDEEISEELQQERN